MNLFDIFYYDDTSPSRLRWKVDRAGNNNSIRVKKGAVAGTLNSHGYYVVGCNGITLQVHRVIWEVCYGTIPAEMDIDHINGIRSDNSISNLRVVTRAYNMRNRAMSSLNLSGVNGVSRTVKRGKYGQELPSWVCTWSENGKQRLKSFSVTRYGETEAFEMACNYREKMLNKLNESGAGYTGRHGA